MCIVPRAAVHAVINNNLQLLYLVEQHYNILLVACSFHYARTPSQTQHYKLKP